MTLWHKEPPNMLLNLFSVGHLLLGMWPNLISSWFPSETHLEETKFSLVSSYQLVMQCTFSWGRKRALFCILQHLSIMKQIVAAKWDHSFCLEVCFTLHVGVM